MNFGFDSLAFAFEVLCFICRAVLSMTDGGATHPQGMRGRRADNVAEGCSVVISPRFHPSAVRLHRLPKNVTISSVCFWAGAFRGSFM